MSVRFKLTPADQHEKFIADIEPYIKIKESVYSMCTSVSVIITDCGIEYRRNFTASQKQVIDSIDEIIELLRIRNDH